MPRRLTGTCLWGRLLVSRVSRSVPRRASLLAAALLLGAGAVAGCQSNPKPPPLDSTAKSISPSPTPSPTQAAPTLPADAKGTSKAAAKAFVRHYISLVNHAATTGDTAALRAASDPRCASCNAVIERVESVYSAGGSIAGDGWRVVSLTAVPAQPPQRPRLDVGLIMSPQKVVARKGARETGFKGGRLPATFSLAWQGRQWRVLHWERAA